MLALLLSLTTVKIQAAPYSGVSGAVVENGLVAKNVTTDSGKVVGAESTTTIYAQPDANSEVVGRVIKNQIIRVLESDDGFYKIQYNGSFAFVGCSDFVEGDELVKFITKNQEWFVRNVVIETDTVLYDWVTGNTLASATVGDSFQLNSISDDYYVAIYTTVSSDGEETNTLVNVPKNCSKLSYDVHVTAFDNNSFNNAEQLDLVEYACSLVGTPYVWGGTDVETGVDCSGFTQAVYAHFGYSIPRCSWQQAEYGTRVSLDDLQPGDLIFYQRGSRVGHVTMYIGDGQCVQARSRGYGVCVTAYDYSEPLHAIRIIGEVEK